MAPPVSDEVIRLLGALFEQRSLLDRVRGQDHRITILREIEGSREVRVVPSILPLLVTDGAIARHVGRTIVGLIREVTPAELAWVDERVRHGSYAYYPPGAWYQLAPGAISHLARTAELDVAVTGLMASHANGFVRAAALEVLAQETDGREIPFLTLRANDWVEAVAARATELLVDRLQPSNRHAVIDALPFIVRVLGQRRRAHAVIERALASVLRSDGGAAALASAPGLATPVRRVMYELLTGGEGAVESHLIEAALKDADPVIRARAVRLVATAPSDIEHRFALLSRLLRQDPVPAVRKQALATLSEQMPARVGELFPDILLDRSASVRGLARFVARTHNLPLDAREVYVLALGSTAPRSVSAAIEGVGEIGAGADADLVAPFLISSTPRLRRSSLRALAKVNAERAVAGSVAALGDGSSSVRATAVNVLAANARIVDFESVNRRLLSLPDQRIRGHLLNVLMGAPKWESIAFLLEALTGPDDEVRTSASRLVGRWVDGFNCSHAQPTASQLRRVRGLLESAVGQLPEATARMLRFSIGAP